MALLALGCSGAREPNRPNVLFIVVDTLRADHLGSYGYERPTTPSIDALATESARFARAYASAPWTKPSVASMITGLHPSTHTVLRLGSSLPQSALTLAERLRTAGYSTAAIVAHHLIDAEFGFDQGYDTFHQDHAGGHMGITTGPVTDEAIGLLDQLSTGDAPFFLFVHYFDPHFVYLRHPAYGFAGERPPRIRWNRGVAGLRRLDPPPDETEIAFLVAAYDEEIRHTDAGIGRLIGALRERGLFDDTLIVFTADHGEEFFERGWLGHSITVFEELVRVPLIIRPPGVGQTGHIVDAPVSLVSLTPTILDAVGVAYAEHDFQETSLMPYVRDASTAAAAPVYVELDFDRSPLERTADPRGTVRKTAIVSGTLKLMLDESTGEYELFDLERDPDEQHDVSAEHPDLLQELRATLHAKMDAVRADGLQAHSRTLTDDQKHMLEELGYLEQ
jgi:arylsulfatase A-like enzyme